MCGIVVALPVYSDGEALPAGTLADALPVFPEAVFSGGPDEVADELSVLTERLGAAIELYGTSGAMVTLATEPERVATEVWRLTKSVARLEEQLDAQTATWDADAMEHVQGQVRQLFLVGSGR